jgi:membrane protein involved in colicin uptake
MTTEPAIVVTPDGPNDAETARAAAEQAQLAAAGAMALSETAAATVNDQAAETVAAYEERLTAWQAQTETLKADLAAEREANNARHAAILSELQSIRSPPPPPPADPPSPSPGSSATEPGAEPPAEPAPVRKKAHRWI